MPRTNHACSHLPSGGSAQRIGPGVRPGSRGGTAWEHRASVLSQAGRSPPPERSPTRQAQRGTPRHAQPALPHGGRQAWPRRLHHHTPNKDEKDAQQNIPISRAATEYTTHNLTDVVSPNCVRKPFPQG